MSGLRAWNARAASRVTPARAASLVLVASIAILGSALLSQYVGGLKPCSLCLYQRVPYVITIGLGAIGLGALALAVILPRRERAATGLTRAVLALCAGAFIVGAGIAAYHVGVEQHWWTSSCSGIDFSKGTVEELAKRLEATPMVRCDEVPWSMFGVSMAGYNVLVSLLLAGAALWMARAMAAGPKSG